MKEKKPDTHKNKTNKQTNNSIMLPLPNYLLNCSLPNWKRLIFKSSKYPHTDRKFLV